MVFGKCSVVQFQNSARRSSLIVVYSILAVLKRRLYLRLLTFVGPPSSALLFSVVRMPSTTHFTLVLNSAVPYYTAPPTTFRLVSGLLINRSRCIIWGYFLTFNCSRFLTVSIQFLRLIFSFVSARCYSSSRVDFPATNFCCLSEALRSITSAGASE
jgi:hypothetical protein